MNKGLYNFPKNRTYDTKYHTLVESASYATTASHAVTASYIDPTYISSSAAAAGFGSGGGGSVDISGLLATSSFNNYTGSITSRFFGTSSFALTASLAPDYVLSSATSSLIKNNQTSSFLTTGSLNTTQIISGSLIIQQDLTVFGSSSITNVSSSTLNIGTNLITVNTFNPTNRFGGLAIIDSGSSPQVSASFLYDSAQDEFIFVHRGASAAITSSHFLMGPETYNQVGDETYISTNSILKSQGNEHVTSSNITDTGTVVSINSNTQVTGSLNVTAGITGSLQGAVTETDTDYEYLLISSFRTTYNY